MKSIGNEPDLGKRVEGVWSLNEEPHPFERLRKLPDFLDRNKRVRVVFDYDPDWENAHISIWGFNWDGKVK